MQPTQPSSSTPTATTATGPTPGAIVGPAYVRAVARFAYLWGWPLVNMHNRRVAMSQVPRPGLSGGVVPVAPLGQLAMLTDYVTPVQRYVACPNQDVVYGFGCLALEQGPVVLQVPDFGDRFWVWQLCDQRTDAFGELGAMYGTRPGFYLVVGPDEKAGGKPPAGITAVFRSPTNTALIAPRAFLNDTPEDRAAIQPVIGQVAAYPLAAFDGKMKKTDWAALPSFPDPAAGKSGGAEVQWVNPDAFFTTLAAVLNEVPPLPGEEALVQQFRALLAAAAANRDIMALLNQTAHEAEAELVTPLKEFHNYGIPLPRGWTTQTNGAQFGTDYLTRTAVARSNILVNRPAETRYFYLDVDGAGRRFDGTSRYTVRFERGALPPVHRNGFWSLTVYNDDHFFHPNALGRYSLGTKNKTLHTEPDGSLTLVVQAPEPAAPEAKANWLPTPAAGAFSLYLRAYWPDDAILDARWTPPPAVRA